MTGGIPQMALITCKKNTSTQSIMMNPMNSKNYKSITLNSTTKEHTLTNMDIPKKRTSRNIHKSKPWLKVRTSIRTNDIQVSRPRKESPF